MKPAPAIDYPRHFAWLGVAVILIVAMSYAGVSGVPFAFYGALHASTCVLALPPRPPLWRALCFVIVAAILCELNFLGGLQLRAAFMAMLGTSGLYALVGLAAFVGSLAYAVAMRVFWKLEWRWSVFVQIAALCSAAGLFAVLTGRHTMLLGGWWLVMLWWIAFSGGMAWADGREQVTDSTTDKA